MIQKEELCYFYLNLINKRYIIYSKLKVIRLRFSLLLPTIDSKVSNINYLKIDAIKTCFEFEYLLLTLSFFFSAVLIKNILNSYNKKKLENERNQSKLKLFH